MSSAFTVTVIEAESADSEHEIKVNVVENEYFVTVEHSMEKDHFISFLAAISDQQVQFFKLYPEGRAETRFQINRVKKIYAYCNRHGLFQLLL